MARETWLGAWQQVLRVAVGDSLTRPVRVTQCELMLCNTDGSSTLLHIHPGVSCCQARAASGTAAQLMLLVSLPVCLDWQLRCSGLDSVLLALVFAKTHVGRSNAVPRRTDGGR